MAPEVSVRMNGIGPLQLIVIDFDSALLPPLVHAQLDDLRRRGLMRLVDSVVAAKGNDGELIILDTLDAPRGDPLWSGVLAHALFGKPGQKRWSASTLQSRDRQSLRQAELGVTEEQLLDIADLIPTNSRALILLIEHLWEADLDMAAAEAQGHVLASCWIAPTMLAQMIERDRPLLK
jgi:uncharacterized membrane protein